MTCPSLWVGKGERAWVAQKVWSQGWERSGRRAGRAAGPVWGPGRGLCPRSGRTCHRCRWWQTTPVSVGVSHSAKSLRTSIYNKHLRWIAALKGAACDPGNAPLTCRKLSDSLWRRWKPAWMRRHGQIWASASSLHSWCEMQNCIISKLKAYIQIHVRGLINCIMQVGIG